MVRLVEYQVTHNHTFRITGHCKKNSSVIGKIFSQQAAGQIFGLPVIETQWHSRDFTMVSCSGSLTLHNNTWSSICKK